jgi:hypothetical protein
MAGALDISSVFCCSVKEVWGAARLCPAVMSLAALMQGQNADE